MNHWMDTYKNDVLTTLQTAVHDWLPYALEHTKGNWHQAVDLIDGYLTTEVKQDPEIIAEVVFALEQINKQQQVEIS